VIGDHKESTLVQAYGPEARGGACSAQVIIAEGAIHYPYVRHPDILVCMSQGGFDKFFGDMKEERNPDHRPGPGQPGAALPKRE
jgi:2-oxoglutarate ferredoxin oxidoreductase subunit gamma